MLMSKAIYDFCRLTSLKRFHIAKSLVALHLLPGGSSFLGGSWQFSLFLNNTSEHWAGSGRPLERLEPPVEERARHFLYRSVWPPLSLQGCGIAQPPAQRVNKTKVMQARAWLHNQVSAFTRDQSRRGGRSALTSSSCHQHLMKNGYALQGSGPETLSSYEGTPSPDCWARAYFLSDPINLVVLAEL